MNAGAATSEAATLRADCAVAAVPSDGIGTKRSCGRAVAAAHLFSDTKAFLHGYIRLSTRRPGGELDDHTAGGRFGAGREAGDHGRDAARDYPQPRPGRVLSALDHDRQDRQAE